MRMRSTLALLAATLFPAVPVAYAALGSIDFQKVEISYSGKNGRPEAPVIVASNKDADGKWRTTNERARFKLRVHVKLNSGSDVTNIDIGVPGIGAPASWSAYSVPSSMSAREVIVDPTTAEIPSNALGIPSLTAASMCEGAGRGGTFKLAMKLNFGIEVRATRGITHNESRRRIFNRELPVEIQCIAVSHTVAEPQRTPGAPQRTPGAPQRTPGDPKRTALPFRPLTADLGFARASNVAGCPVDIRQSIRIVSQGPGTAKVYIVRQDNPGVLGAPIYVNVTTRMPDAKYVGVLQKTVRFTSTLKRSYRVLAVNPFGEPIASPWAVLDVRC